MQTSKTSNGSDGTRVGWQLKVHPQLSGIDPEAWQALLGLQAHPSPFARLDVLTAMEASGSALARTGWQSLFLTVSDESGELLGAAPLYAKSHSYGEYVFDWAWARAFEQAGGQYYPKLLCALPFSPVPGSRLLVSHDDARQALLRGMEDLATEQGWSSVHLLLGDEADLSAVKARGWLIREGVQFHWMQTSPDRWLSFESFLASLHRDKRKKIQQERRQVRDVGVSFECLEGKAIGPEDWAFFYRCYEATYLAHGNPPYLTKEFFEAVGETCPEHWLLFIAVQNGVRVAASLVAIDRSRGLAWGRYWGTMADIRCLHFEACYYQPLAWCIEQGFHRFEGGAQGEHKMARGLLPTPTWSAHWIADPNLRSAVDRFLAREREGIGAYLEDLEARSPFQQALTLSLKPKS